MKSLKQKALLKEVYQQPQKTKRVQFMQPLQLLVKELEKLLHETKLPIQLITYLNRILRQ